MPADVADDITEIVPRGRDKEKPVEAKTGGSSPRPRPTRPEKKTTSPASSSSPAEKKTKGTKADAGSCRIVTPSSFI